MCVCGLAFSLFFKQLSSVEAPPVTSRHTLPTTIPHVQVPTCHHTRWLQEVQAAGLCSLHWATLIDARQSRGPKCHNTFSARPSRTRISRYPNNRCASALTHTLQHLVITSSRQKTPWTSFIFTELTNTSSVQLKRCVTFSLCWKKYGLLMWHTQGNTTNHLHLL